MPEEIQERLIEDEMKQSYMDYAMSVIVARAIPDVRDGLKPVHRRVLYAMKQLGLDYNKAFKKSANVVGTVLAKFHPHGDMSVYDALVRMAQNFSLRYPLVKGQGNFGCFTGDTKIKLLDGTSKSFKELCELYKKDEIFYVYSINKDGKIVVGEAKNPRLTKKDSEIVEITLDGGEIIRCTPDHRFLLKNLKYKEARYLTPDDSLMPGYFKLSPIRGNTELKDYLMIKDNKEDRYFFVHEIADAYNLERGLYSINDGPVKHHVNFNKLDNSPDNLKRLSWNDHTKIHNTQIKENWKGLGFRLKQRAGVKNFYKNNPEHIEKLRKRLIERNKDLNFIKKSSQKRKELWKNPELRHKLSDKIKENYNKHPERRKCMSEFSKKMWSDKKKRDSIIKSIKRALNKPEIKNKISEKQKKNILEHPEVIQKRAQSIKEFYRNNSEARKLISERSKKLWKENDYRLKFINENHNHLSEMAKKAWQNEEYKKLQIEKMKKLWANENFRKKVIGGIRKSNLLRLKNKPNFMKDIAQKAAMAHKMNWKNDNYKKSIIKNKILYYVNRLITTLGEDNINEENYNKFRTNNCFPRFNNVIRYFKNINEMVVLAKEYNHYVVSIKFLDYIEDVYDITVNENHNFLLDCGVFVHNSVDGDAAAAYRYTEAKLSKMAEEILIDIDKDTVDLVNNFDNSEKEPTVLPSKLPNLLINGSSGIAVGMATNIPPHNIREVCDAIIFAIDHPECNSLELMKFIKGPDFPTGGIILGENGIKSAYESGRGKLTVRAKAEVMEDKIIITEIPYMVNKSLLIEGIAQLVHDKRIEGISDIRDESDRKGMRIVIELKKNFDGELILSQLYKLSSLQTTFGVINLALVNNEPKVLDLKGLIKEFIVHRKTVVIRRTKFELDKAEKRAHILQGLRIALSNIDPVVQLIKRSESVDVARMGLVQRFELTEIQANAILEMRLQRLTSLETRKIQEEYEHLLILIEELKNILADIGKIFGIIKSELSEIKNEYGDERKTLISNQIEEVVTNEDLINEEDIVVTITSSGYAKQTSLELYRSQGRGGTGIRATTTKEEDVVQELFITSNLSQLLFFTNKGRVHWLKAYEIPEASRYAKGGALINLLHLGENEKVSAVLPIKEFDDKHSLIFVTKKGILKKSLLSEYSNPRKGGINAINLNDNDEVVQVRLTPGYLNFIIGTKNGQAVKFNEEDVRVMGRNATGVRGIRLRDDGVIGMEVALEDGDLLTVTENGYGKRTSMGEYRLIKRGGSGVKNINVTEKNGKVVGIKTVKDYDEIMCITVKGQIIRTEVNNISKVGRNSQGVIIMRLKEGDKIASVSRVMKNG